MHYEDTTIDMTIVGLLNGLTDAEKEEANRRVREGENPRDALDYIYAQRGITALGGSAFGGVVENSAIETYSYDSQEEEKPQAINRPNISMGQFLKGALYFCIGFIILLFLSDVEGMINFLKFVGEVVLVVWFLPVIIPLILLVCIWLCHR